MKVRIIVEVEVEDLDHGNMVRDHIEELVSGAEIDALVLPAQEAPHE